MYEFGLFLLDPEERTLSCEGMALALTPKAFDTLLYLVRNPGRTLTKDELLKQIWPDAFVEEGNLCVNISTIRKVLGESVRESRYIETVPGRGYRFVAEVRKVARQKDDDGAITRGDSKPFELITIVNPGDRTTATEPIERENPYQIRPLRWLRSGGVLRVAIPALLLFLVVLPIWAHFRRLMTQKVNTSEISPSIAVLPFADLSPTKDQEYLSDGLAEELIADLAKVPGLKIVARTSSFQFKGRNEDVRSIGKKLGVADILEGSVQRQGDNLRIHVELTKADDGIELWSETYDRKVGEIFSVQDDIARAATAALQVKLLGRTIGSAGVRGTTEDAYEAYLEGQYFFGRGDNETDLGKALAYANRSISSDPNYAPAWALRSRVRSEMADFALTDMSQGYHQAREDAERAVVLNPDFAEGYLALGWIQMNYDWDWTSTEASLAKAAALEPGNADVWHCRSLLSEFQGRLVEAIETQKRAISLDPLRARFYSRLGYQLYFAGRYDESDAALAKALELNPQKEQDHITRGELLLARGLAQQALAEMEQEPDKGWKLFGEALAFYRLGRIHDSDAALQRLIATGGEPWACQIAQIYAYRGERDKAFKWLDRAYQLHDGGLPYMKVDFILRGLKQDARYTSLLEKMRLPTWDS